MVVDVIDIRKRIEKIRNEVSEAIVSKHSYSLPDEQLREDVQFSVEDAEMRESTPGWTRASQHPQRKTVHLHVTAHQAGCSYVWTQWLQTLHF